MEKEKEMIDIIIPVFKRTVHTEKCLKYLKQYTNNYNLILIEKQQSAAKNINEGLKQVKSSWFVIMDDDVYVTSGWLDKLIDIARPDIGQIQPMVLFPFGKVWSAEVAINPLRNVGHLDNDIENYNYIKDDCDLLTGTCGLYNKSILNNGLKQDEGYIGSQYNDLDFSKQIKGAGYKLIYNGNVPVLHGRFLRNTNETNRQYFNEKWGNLK